MGRQISTDTVVWITGASSGIGRALAGAFARKGARLILSARNTAALEEAASESRIAAAAEGKPETEARILRLDAEDLPDLPAAAERAEKMFGRIDILINNAGISHRSLFLETDYAVIGRLIKVNLESHMVLVKAVLPGMVSRRSGLIAGVTSIVGKFGSPQRTVYSAAKHGLHGFYDSLRAEVCGQGIHVVAIVPGFVRTDISKHALTGEGAARNIMDRNQELGATPEHCARQILRGLEKGRDEIYCGMNAKARASLFLHAWFPETFKRIISKADVT